MITLLSGGRVVAEIAPLGRDKRQALIDGIVTWAVLSEKGLEYVKLTVDEKSLNHRKATFEGLPPNSTGVVHTPAASVRPVVVTATYQLRDGDTLSRVTEVGLIVVKDEKSLVSDLFTHAIVDTEVRTDRPNIPIEGDKPKVQVVGGAWVDPDTRTPGMLPQPVEAERRVAAKELLKTINDAKALIPTLLKEKAEKFVETGAFVSDAEWIVKELQKIRAGIHPKVSSGTTSHTADKDKPLVQDVSGDWRPPQD